MDFNGFLNIIQSKFPDISDRKKERFKALGPLYTDWNSKINVISRKDIGQLYLHHVLHSLAIAEYIRLNFHQEYEAMYADSGAGSGISILDLGTGGGFPGIPLAIMFPGADFTLCDSIGKKITVAAGVAGALGLENVTAVNARAESLEGKYTFVVSRAVTSLDKFMPWVKGRYTEGVLYLKGGDVAEEIAMATGRSRLRPGSVHTWRIDSWLEDPYFEGKLVIFIGV